MNANRTDITALREGDQVAIYTKGVGQPVRAQVSSEAFTSPKDSVTRVHLHRLRPDGKLVSPVRSLTLLQRPGDPTVYLERGAYKPQPPKPVTRIEPITEAVVNRTNIPAEGAADKTTSGEEGEPAAIEETKRAGEWGGGYQGPLTPGLRVWAVYHERRFFGRIVGPVYSETESGTSVEVLRSFRAYGVQRNVGDRVMIYWDQRGRERRYEPHSYIVAPVEEGAEPEAAPLIERQVVVYEPTMAPHKVRQLEEKLRRLIVELSVSPQQAMMAVRQIATKSGIEFRPAGAPKQGALPFPARPAKRGLGLSSREWPVGMAEGVDEARRFYSREIEVGGRGFTLEVYFAPDKDTPFEPERGAKGILAGTVSYFGDSDPNQFLDMIEERDLLIEANRAVGSGVRFTWSKGAWVRDRRGGGYSRHLGSNKLTLTEAAVTEAGFRDEPAFRGEPGADHVSYGHTLYRDSDRTAFVSVGLSGVQAGRWARDLPGKAHRAPATARRDIERDKRAKGFREHIYQFAMHEAKRRLDLYPRAQNAVVTISAGSKILDQFNITRKEVEKAIARRKPPEWLGFGESITEGKLDGAGYYVWRSVLGEPMILRGPYRSEDKAQREAERFEDQKGWSVVVSTGADLAKMGVTNR